MRRARRSGATADIGAEFPEFAKFMQGVHS